MTQSRQNLFSMNYLDIFGVLTGVRVDVSKFFGAGAGSESEKCDSVQLCW